MLPGELSRCQIAERAVRAVVIVILPPRFDNSFGLFPVLEYLAVQALVPKLIDEALDVTILPETARIDEQG